ncbi:MAG TPA: hypothetical protein VMV69_08790 [Pirellulales bacterium]|nr:hypothetical protein [Pirellulales bacterium]
MSDETNSVRNPNKKRGRPRGTNGARKFWQDSSRRAGRNYADMLSAIVHGIADKDLKSELLRLADTGDTTLTTLAYVARFPHDRQRDAFNMLNGMGARAAKRWVECVENPPGVQKIANVVAMFLAREFPPVEHATLAEALRLLANTIEGRPPKRR